MDKGSINDSERGRRKCIIDYVSKNPECNKQKVIEECTDDGSRKTILKSIKKLEEEGILKVEKERKNSRSYKLTVVSENLLVTIPQDLEEILKGFQNFVNVIKENCKKRSFDANQTPPYFKKFTDYIEINAITSFPYRLIEIINDIFTFYFIIILPKKIDDQNIVIKLYSIYFENIYKMYISVSKELQYYILPYNLSSIKESTLYQSYMESKNENCFSKVFRLVRICRVFNIEKELYDVLDSAWIKNMDTAILLYKVDHDSSFYAVIQSNLNKQFKENIDKNNGLLNKLHNYIDDSIRSLEKKQ
jgi:hypothetical protein